MTPAAIAPNHPSTKGGRNVACCTRACMLDHSMLTRLWAHPCLTVQRPTHERARRVPNVLAAYRVWAQPSHQERATNKHGAKPPFSLPAYPLRCHLIRLGLAPTAHQVDVPETELTLEQALAKRMADQARARTCHPRPRRTRAHRLRGWCVRSPCPTVDCCSPGTAAEAAAATHLGPNDPMVHLRAALMESHAVERGRNALASRRQSASLDSARRDTMRATGRRGTAAKLRHGSSQAGRRASSPAGRSAGGTRPGTRAGTRPGTAQSRTDGGGEGGGGGTRRSRLFQNEQLQLAAEEHSHRQRQLERVEGLLAASKHLLGARPPA